MMLSTRWNVNGMQKHKRKNQHHIFVSEQGVHNVKSLCHLLKATAGNNVWTELNDVWLKVGKTTFKHNIETFTLFTTNIHL